MNTNNFSSLSEIAINVTDFNFDTIILNRLTSGHPMVRIGQEIFELENFYSLLDCEKSDATNFFSAIESSYLEQHFHNATHGADVMQAVYSLLVNSLVHNHLEPVERLAVVIAAATHDIAHPGVNNTFLVNKNDTLCQTFGKESTLEKFHLTTALKVIEETKILENLPESDQEKVKSFVKELILATDPAKHNNNKTEFLKIKKELNFENPSHLLQVLKQAMICGDISGQARKLEIATQWGERVYEEFFCLGDLELELNLEVQKLNDRNTVNVNKGQVGFIQFCVRPVFEAWNEIFENEFSLDILENLDFNSEHYSSLL